MAKLKLRVKDLPQAKKAIQKEFKLAIVNREKRMIATLLKALSDLPNDTDINDNPKHD